MNADAPPLMESPPGPETIISGVRHLYFAGTGYLGLHGRAEVIEAGCAALRQFGVHSATTRAGFGTTPPLLAVEQLAARFFGTEDAFYFSSGYSANHVVLQALAGEFDAVFMDEAVHFAVAEASRLTGHAVHSFRAGDATDLARQLRMHLRAGQRPLVLADSVAPSTGALAPLREHLNALREFAPAVLHLDEAHAFGVLGPDGRGLYDHEGLWSHVNGGPAADGVKLTACGTLAKALGGFGGIVPGTVEFVQRARRGSHYFDGASAPPSAVCGSTTAALDICLREPELRQRLAANVRQVREGLRAMGIPVSDAPTPNIGAVFGSAAHMQRMHATLREERILVPYVPAYPGTGPEGVLRIAVCAGHTSAMISRLLDAIQRHHATA